MTPTAMALELAALRREVADLRAALAEREEAFDAGATNIMQAFGVTIYQARFLMALSSGRLMERSQIERLCSRVEVEDPRHGDQQVKRLRRKNIPGLNIRAVYGAGYIIEGDSLAAVRVAIDPNLDTRKLRHGSLSCRPRHQGSHEAHR